jgi:radical SAM protein with 4Fe4S-binding SPASM domain
MSKDLKTSPNFCVAPWMHLHVIPDGRAFACCQTPILDENSFGNVKTENILDIVNSPIAKKMRKDMLDDKPLPEACHRCKDKQSHNLNTMRTGLNNRWFDETYDIIQKTENDGTIPEVKLKYWDFRFSNYCNLACTTCSPLFSTSWASDWIKLYPTWDHSETKLKDLDDAGLFWEYIEENLESIKEIYFAGGEPLMMPEHWKLLDMLDQKKKYDLTLKYSTNVTTLGKEKQDILAKWKNFNYVHLSLSVDGYGESFEYIRYKGKWNLVLENLKRIRNSGVVDYWIHPTVSILNIFRLTELHDVLHREDIIPLRQIHKKRGFNIENYWVDRFHLNPLFTPAYSSITVLPHNLKDRVADKISTYGNMMLKQHRIPFTGWQNIIDFMYQQDNSHLWDQFLSETIKLDKIRETDIFKINPELKDG